MCSASTQQWAGSSFLARTPRQVEQLSSCSATRHGKAALAELRTSSDERSSSTTRLSPLSVSGPKALKGCTLFLAPRYVGPVDDGGANPAGPAAARPERPRDSSLYGSGPPRARSFACSVSGRDEHSRSRSRKRVSRHGSGPGRHAAALNRSRLRSGTAAAVLWKRLADGYRGACAAHRLFQRT